MASTGSTARRSAPAVALYELLNPLPFGFFTAAWIFDILYAKTYDIFWTQAASWLITLGLLLAIIPRLINLVQVWVGHAYPQGSPVKVHFWANALAIVLAIVNAFIHSRDAYAVVPEGVILSTLVVLLLAFANLQLALRAQGTAKIQGVTR
ncbi:hypothetical protein CYR55_02930 [Chimaeribacter californicus]|uniref:DUF2231 domain-containing protein n=1 Tax=Chimaeribacter californicus TaxID=2060067 RepID=A0A2N5EGW9_9GAMM|nr:DUF2231 domain-containing protein [Chimaeribacter californicus]PLR41793.1 hypothetical protein CYR55_02930 [Chimaeribacter californicus]